MKKLPSFRLHTSSNQGVCLINGRSFFLGPYNSPESLGKNHRLFAEYLTNPSFGLEKNRQCVAESVKNRGFFSEQAKQNPNHESLEVVSTVTPISSALCISPTISFDAQFAR